MRPGSARLFDDSDEALCALERIHRWIGVGLTAWLVMATLSGALLLWKDEYYGWRYPELPKQPYAPSVSAVVIDRIVSGFSQIRLGSGTLSSASIGS